MKHSLSCTEWILLAGGPAMRDERSGLAAIVVLSAVALFGLLGAVPNVLALVASAALLAGASVRLALALVADRLDPGASSGRLLVQLTKNPTFAQLTGAIVAGAFTLIAAAAAVGQQGPTPDDQSAGIAHGRGGWEYSSSCRNRGGLVGSKRGAVSAEADPDADPGAYS